MNQNLYSANELVRIIKACGDAGVRRVKLLDTEIEFGVECLCETTTPIDNLNIEPVQEDHNIPVERIEELQELEDAELKEYYSLNNPEEFEMDKLMSESNNDRT